MTLHFLSNDFTGTMEVITRSGGDAFEVGSNFDADYWMRDGKSLKVSYTAKDAGSNHVIVRPGHIVIHRAMGPIS